MNAVAIVIGIILGFWGCILIIIVHNYIEELCKNSTAKPIPVHKDAGCERKLYQYYKDLDNFRQELKEESKNDG